MPILQTNKKTFPFPGLHSLELSPSTLGLLFPKFNRLSRRIISQPNNQDNTQCQTPLSSSLNPIIPLKFSQPTISHFYKNTAFEPLKMHNNRLLTQCPYTTLKRSWTNSQHPNPHHALSALHTFQKNTSFQSSPSF